MSLTKLTIPLDKDDALAAALGRLLGHWAVCEQELTRALAITLGVEHDKARFIWEGFISATGKIALAERINLHFSTDNARQNALAALLKIAGSLNTKRNAFIHALWAEAPSGIVRIQTSNKNVKKKHSGAEPFTAEQVQTVVEDIAELSASLYRWSRQHPKVTG